MRKLPHATARIFSFGVAAVMCFGLTACSNSDDRPSGVTFSSDMDAAATVDAPSLDENGVTADHRPVAYIRSSAFDIVLSLGNNSCGLAAEGDSMGDEAFSINLKSVPEGQIKASKDLGKYAEAGTTGVNGSEWVLRCGSEGVELCGVSVTGDAEVVGLARSGECLALEVNGA